MNTIAVQSNTANAESLIRQAFGVCTQNSENLRFLCEPLSESAYFLDVIERYFKPQYMMEECPKVVVFGTDFPMETIHSLTGKPPYWVIGGNRGFTAASDEYVPRDTDPVTRAALGQLMTMEHAKKETLVIVPCSSDAQRKSAYLLQSNGWKVVTLWIPAVQDTQSLKAFQSEMNHAIETVCRHLGKRFSQRALARSAQYVNRIRASIHEFLDTAQDHEALMPGNLRMAILDSFFMTNDLDGWHTHLKALTEELKKNSQKQQTSAPRVLLIGSPVYFPNFKIPMLLSGAGIGICGSIDSRTGQYETAFSAQSQRGLASLASYYFTRDSSSAFVTNEQLVKAIRHYIDETKPDGIIWHVLKGQIEYDFELSRNEAYFEEKDLPVIRLETDYQDQDVEQLRIRIEAFAELLTQKKKEKGENFV